MKKGKIKTILEDYWNEFLKAYKNKIRSNVKKEVEKVLKCKDIKYGLIELKCGNCNTYIWKRLKVESSCTYDGYRRWKRKHN